MKSEYATSDDFRKLFTEGHNHTPPGNAPFF